MRLSAIAQAYPDLIIDWVETGRRKNAAEDPKSNEKTDKAKDSRTKVANPPKDRRTKVVKPKVNRTAAAKAKGSRTNAAKLKDGRANAKGGKKRMEGKKPTRSLSQRPAS